MKPFASVDQTSTSPLVSAQKFDIDEKEIEPNLKSSPLKQPGKDPTKQKKSLQVQFQSMDDVVEN